MRFGAVKAMQKALQYVHSPSGHQDTWRKAGWGARQVSAGGAGTVQVGGGVEAAQQVGQERAAQRAHGLHQLAVQRREAAHRRGRRAWHPDSHAHVTHLQLPHIYSAARLPLKSRTRRPARGVQRRNATSIETLSTTLAMKLAHTAI